MLTGSPTYATVGTYVPVMNRGPVASNTEIAIESVAVLLSVSVQTAAASRAPGTAMAYEPALWLSSVSVAADAKAPPVSLRDARSGNGSWPFQIAKMLPESDPAMPELNGFSFDPITVVGGPGKSAGGSPAGRVDVRISPPPAYVATA